MSGSRARRRALFPLSFTPTPSPLRVPPVPRHPQALPPSPARRSRDSLPHRLRSPGAASTISSPRPGEPGRTSVLSSPALSSSAHPQVHQGRSRRINQASRPNQMSPINATNPALTPIYNSIVFLCCCLPGPGGRGIEVGLFPRISTGETPGERRRREAKERRRKERGEEVESSSTEIPSGEGSESGNEEGQGRGRPGEGKGKGKERGKSKTGSASGEGSTISGSRTSSSSSSSGPTGSGSSSSSRSSSGSSSSGSSSASGSSSGASSRQKGDSQISASGSSSSGVCLT